MFPPSDEDLDNAYATNTQNYCVYIRLENSREFQLKSEHQLGKSENILGAELPPCCSKTGSSCQQVV